jgi:hypothetical protein
MRKAMIAKVQSDVSDKHSKKDSTPGTHDPHAGFFGGV